LDEHLCEGEEVSEGQQDVARRLQDRLDEMTRSR
jgi:hypothetical protein